MLNFTIGPVMVEEDIRKIGAEQPPYFRTPEFSKIMMENEVLMKKLLYADEDARAVFLTGSGTAAMEAAVINSFDHNDNVLVVNGGSFGQRFTEICRIHKIPYTEIKLKYGQALKYDDIRGYENQGYTGMLINMHETSTGVLYDMQLISEFCRRNQVFLVVDAISAFIADPIYMKEWQIDIVLTGSQKALAIPPGISILVLSSNAVDRINRMQAQTMYLDLKSALKNGESGQTPFTPAVTILLQLHERLCRIGGRGIEQERNQIKGLARQFREAVAELPIKMASDSMSNALTPLCPLNASAYDIFEMLKDEYGMWVCPNGGELRDKIFRVGHIGAITKEDNQALIQALKEMSAQGFL